MKGPRLDVIVWTTRQALLLWAIDHLARDSRAEKPRTEALQKLTATALGVPQQEGPGAYRREVKRP